MNHHRRSAEALAKNYSITVPEAEALIVACLGDVARAERAAAGANVLAAVRAELAIKSSASTNIIEATAPADRPHEAICQLRDIGEWLQAEGKHELAEAADDLANDLDREYSETV